ncbi:MAG: hypothetical protein L6437_16520 [Kiritimatiellae bacterium]|nr:hypothetical protein [Kiritimatiellia bacterium]
MKFILGLLIGGGLVFWWYMHGASNVELKKADAEIPALAAEKAKIRADYEVQLKAAEDQVENLNTELIKTRADLVTAQAKLTNMVKTVYVSPRLKKPVSKPVVVAAPRPVSVPPKVAKPAPKKPKPVAPVKSGLGGPRPSSPVKKSVAVPPPPGGGLMYNDGQGRSYRIVNGQRIYY